MIVVRVVCPIQACRILTYLTPDLCLELSNAFYSTLMISLIFHIHTRESNEGECKGGRLGYIPVSHIFRNLQSHRYLQGTGPGLIAPQHAKEPILALRRPITQTGLCARFQE